MKKTLHTKYGIATLHSTGYYIITSAKEGNHNLSLHRLIFEDFYNFKIPKGYIVHHKNGIKTDNCILNLQMLKNAEHVSQHNSGENNHFYGKRHSAETKRIISEIHKGRKFSKERRERMSKSFSRENHPRWGTSIIDEWGGIWFLKEMKQQLNTLTTVAEYMGIQPPVISKYLKRRDLTWDSL